MTENFRKIPSEAELGETINALMHWCLTTKASQAEIARLASVSPVSIHKIRKMWKDKGELSNCGAHTLIGLARAYHAITRQERLAALKGKPRDRRPRPADRPAP